MLDDYLYEAMLKAVQDLHDQVMAMKPIVTRGNLFESALYAKYVEYGRPHSHDEANTVEGSIVQPITDEGRLLK